MFLLFFYFFSKDELLWGAAWLHKASRRRQYREYIVKNEVVLRAGDTINEFGWDNKHAGINVLISKVIPIPITELNNPRIIIIVGIDLSIWLYIHVI